MVKIGTLFICLILIGCGSPSVENNATSPPAPSPIPTSSPIPTPTITDEERKAFADERAAEKDKAIQDFISRYYKGWTLQGVGNAYGECDGEDICDLHLVSGSRTTVVPVVLRQFTKTDGTAYWFVFAARQIDLLKSRIDAIFRQGEDSALENLTLYDCENICADEWEAARERMDYTADDDLVPADPRWGG